MLYSRVLAAGETLEVGPGSSLLIKSARETVTVELFVDRTLIESFEGVGTQFSITRAFDWARITTAAAQTVDVLTSGGVVSDPGGNAVHTANSRATVQTTITASATAVEILPADPTRINAILQTTGIIFVGPTDAVDDTNGIQLNPGESLSDTNTAALYAYSAVGAVVSLMLGRRV